MQGRNKGVLPKPEKKGQPHPGFRCNPSACTEYRGPKLPKSKINTKIILKINVAINLFINQDINCFGFTL